MRIIRRIEIDTDHPAAETAVRIAAANLADTLDRRGVQWSIVVTDAAGIPLEAHGEAYGHESEN